MVCKGDASVFLPHARAYYCNIDFIQYLVKRVKKTIEKYKLISSGEKVLVAISGGKDSITLLDILAVLRADLNFKIHALHIDLGIRGYSEDSKDKCLKASKSLGIPLTVISIPKTFNLSLPELAKRSKREACSICGSIKRYITNLAAYYWGVDRVATGHTLDDLSTYTLKNLLVGDYTMISKLQPKTQTLKSLISRVRPLAEVYNEETRMYVLIKRLPHVYENCPLTPKRSLDLSVKGFLDSIEREHPSIKLGFYKSTIKAFKRLTTSPIEAQEDLVECRICKMLASSRICSFCKLMLASGKKPEDIVEFHEYVKGLGSEVEYS